MKCVYDPSKSMRTNYNRILAEVKGGSASDTSTSGASFACISCWVLASSDRHKLRPWVAPLLIMRVHTYINHHTAMSACHIYMQWPEEARFEKPAGRQLLL